MLAHSPARLPGRVTSTTAIGSFFTSGLWEFSLGSVLRRDVFFPFSQLSLFLFLCSLFLPCFDREEQIDHHLKKKKKKELFHFPETVNRPVNGAFCSPSAWVHLAPISLSVSLVLIEPLGLFRTQKLLRVGTFHTEVVKNPKLAYISSELALVIPRVGLLGSPELSLNPVRLLRWLQILEMV